MSRLLRLWQGRNSEWEQGPQIANAFANFSLPLLVPGAQGSRSMRGIGAAGAGAGSRLCGEWLTRPRALGFLELRHLRRRAGCRNLRALWACSVAAVWRLQLRGMGAVPERKATPECEAELAELAGSCVCAVSSTLLSAVFDQSADPLLLTLYFRTLI